MTCRNCTVPFRYVLPPSIFYTSLREKCDMTLVLCQVIKNHVIGRLGTTSLFFWIWFTNPFWKFEMTIKKMIWCYEVRQLLQNETENRYYKVITRCDGRLLQILFRITYEVWKPVITKWNVVSIIWFVLKY